MNRIFENTSRGIAIIEVRDENEARIIPENEPEIKAGILNEEVLIADAIFGNFKIYLSHKSFIDERISLKKKL